MNAYTSNVINLRDYRDGNNVILFCAISGPEKRDYLIKVAQENMTNSEYVHVLLTMRSVGYGVQTSVGKKTFANGLTPLWESFSVAADGNETMAKRAAEKMLVIDVNSDVQDTDFLQYLTKNIANAVRDPPMNCNSSACINASSTSMGSYARHLFDVFYLYGQAIDRLNTTDPAVYQDLAYLIPQLITSFDGMTGRVQVSKTLYRVPFYQLYGLDANYEQIPLVNMTFFNSSSTMSMGYTTANEGTAVWHFWDNKRPTDSPICGFSGRYCPVQFWDQYGALVFVAAVVILFLLFIMFTCVACVLRNRRLEQERLNSEWQIPAIKLIMPERHKKPNSRRSINSGPSTVTGDSKMTMDSGMGFHENYTVQMYEKDLVLTTKHHGTQLSREDRDKFARLRKMDHDNLNKFIGLSIDGPMYVAVWKMCSRGSLQDIIARGNFSMDGFFMFCIIRDIAEGMNYIHKTFLRVHGNLRSATCLVNDSWQVKLAEFGLDNLLEEHTPTKKRLLWAAPEVLRGSLTVSQMEPSADVYSFAIIASEILTKREAWDIANRKEGADEILYMIKKGGGSGAIRPELILDAEVSPSLTTLVKDCWADVPEDRPKSEQICRLLFEMTPKANTNLMDHVFNMLEEYTTTLEVDIEERTKELTLEKKKADILLSRMLPKQVAERLKAGQTVEPEGFDSVTVFFSDVVKFTILAAKCSPFQVVNLLNDLYSNFDTIIEEHGVYKVESIGDGYLCVSGLPTRNGYAHIKQIVDMSLQFMEYCRKFKIPHLPREQVELRIGINSGPCVAGVVGLSMPRYCLFGDTVNTASRMESNGKPSMIHMSEAAHSLLTSHYPHQYETNSRGEVIIKGKGVMETFWVLGKSGETNSLSTRTTPPVTDENWPPQFKEEQRKRAVTPYPERVVTTANRRRDTLHVTDA
ncbi:hypothetical protein GCK72_004279 [Caenorhabditis remanei]|uniref:Guanylate cyclase n=1 Tax=Caenorhabditis remanei TaxID=31234 RepID=A0A6A5HD71_CAERE|nr:hypothetical protein GCK72_004279 [Caenorhabditis remanei]KAF1764332.1 hypothetical protein GCK72_004279 [Caenorhabditis remanei]